MQGRTPTQYPTSAEQSSGASGCGVDPTLALVEIPLDEGIDAANIHAYAHCFYAAAFERIGGFRAVDVLVKRFLRGDVRIGPGDLQTQVCHHIESERLRFSNDDRDRVLRQLSDDTKLDGDIARLADACIAWDLSGRHCITGTSLPKVAAQAMVRTAIEQLQRHVSEKSAGGVGLIAREATAQMIECKNILDHEDIGTIVPGGDIFERIAWLTPHETGRATVEEARRMMTVGSIGRQLFIELAKEVGQLDSISDGAVETICAFVLEYQFANGSISMDIDEVPGRRQAAADEHARQVIFFRGGGSA
jgi:hypothetical protein